MSEASAVHPYPLAILLCDNIIIEAETYKKTLVGLFENVFAQGFPSFHQMGIYLKITDAEGSYRFRVDYVDVSRDQILDRRDIGPAEITDRLSPGEIVVKIGVPIPEPGTYEFRFYANDFYLARTAFRASLVADQGEKEG